MWYMRWGNTDEAMKMVRRFAEKSKGKGPVDLAGDRKFVCEVAYNLVVVAER